MGSIINFLVPTPAVLLALSALFLVFALTIFSVKFVHTIIRKYRKILLDRARVALLKYIDRGDEKLLKEFDRHRDMADLICKVAVPLSSANLSSFADVYLKLGFLKKDLEDIHRYNLRYKVNAIIRLRALKLDLPDQVWFLLLKDRNQMLRWATLEYLISIKDCASLPWLVWYLRVNPKAPKGMVKHLVTCWLSRNFQHADLIVNALDSETMIIVLLEVLALYPIYSRQLFIMNAIKKYPLPAVIVPGLKALENIASADIYSFIINYLDHDDGRVRRLAIACLKNIDVQSNLSIFANAILDPDVEVRTTAMHILIASGAAGYSLLVEISSNQKHPCFDILTRLRNMAIAQNRRTA